MKKGLKLLLLSVLAVPFVAKADVATPTFRGYDAVVSKTDGLKVCDEDNECLEIANGEKFKIISIYDQNEGGVNGTIDPLYSIEYNGKKLYDVKIDSNSIRPYKEVVEVTDEGITKLKNVLKLKTLREVELRKGPEVTYDVIGKIPANTELSFQYIIDSDDDPTGAYVEYNGKSGWIDTIHATVLFYEDTYAVAYKDVKTKCGTIKMGSFVKGIGRTDRYNLVGYYTYNGCEFNSLDDNTIGLYDFRYPEYYKANKDIAIYEDSSKKNNAIKTIKKGEEFILVISYDNYELSGAPGFVYYDGTTGFVKYDDGDVEEVEGKTVEYKTMGLEEPVYKFEYDNNEVNDKPADKKTDDKKPDDKKDNNQYIIIGVVIGSVLIIGGLVFALLKKKKVQE